MLKTYASSAIRLARAAQEQGIDLTGRVLFTGGEPLTAERERYLAECGIRAYPRYAATEAGILAGACPHRVSQDEMHFYQDRLALVTQELPNPAGGRPLQGFLITSLSPTRPRCCSTRTWVILAGSAAVTVPVCLASLVGPDPSGQD